MNILALADAQGVVVNIPSIGFAKKFRKFHRLKHEGRERINERTEMFFSRIKYQRCGGGSGVGPGWAWTESRNSPRIIRQE